MHLDWQVEFVPSPGGIADWRPAEIDFILNATATVPTAGSGIMLSGRSPLTGGASATLSSAVATTLAQIASIGGTGPVPIGKRERFYSAKAQELVTTFQAFQIGATTTSGTAPAQGASSGSTSTPVDPPSPHDIAGALQQ